METFELNIPVESPEQQKEKKIGSYLICTFDSIQKRLWGKEHLEKSN